MRDPSWLDELERDAIEQIRSALAEAARPALLFSGGKASTVLAHLVLRSVHPSPAPLPLLHIDSTWEFRELLHFRTMFAARHHFQLVIHHDEQGRRADLNPVRDWPAYVEVMQAGALQTALAAGGYDLVLSGFRDPGMEKSGGDQPAGPFRTAREACPLRNWTDMDLWAWILSRRVSLCPLYFASLRPVVHTPDGWIIVDDPVRGRRLGFGPPEHRQVRLSALGCWPVTQATRSQARTLDSVISEIFTGTSRTLPVR